MHFILENSENPSSQIFDVGKHKEVQTVLPSSAIVEILEGVISNSSSQEGGSWYFSSHLLNNEQCFNIQNVNFIPLIN